MQVQQNLHEAVTGFAKLKEQLEKNTAAISVLQNLYEVSGYFAELALMYMYVVLYQWWAVTIPPVEVYLKF